MQVQFMQNATCTSKIILICGVRGLSLPSWFEEMFRVRRRSVAVRDERTCCDDKIGSGDYMFMGGTGDAVFGWKGEN